MKTTHPPTTPPTVPGILFSEVKNVVGDVVSISKKEEFPHLSQLLYDVT